MERDLGNLIQQGSSTSLESGEGRAGQRGGGFRVRLDRAWLLQVWGECARCKDWRVRSQKLGQGVE